MPAVAAENNGVLVRVDVKPKYKRVIQNKFNDAMTLQDHLSRLDKKIEEQGIRCKEDKKAIEGKFEEERIRYEEDKKAQHQQNENIKWLYVEQNKKLEEVKERLAMSSSEKLGIEHALARRELLKLSRDKLCEQYKHSLPEGFSSLSRHKKAAALYQVLNATDKRHLLYKDVQILFGAETAKFDDSVCGKGNIVAHRARQKGCRSAIEALEEGDLRGSLNRIFGIINRER